MTVTNKAANSGVSIKQVPSSANMSGKGPGALYDSVKQGKAHTTPRSSAAAGKGAWSANSSAAYTTFKGSNSKRAR